MEQQNWTADTISELLREHGLRVTSPRIAICLRLLEQHSHYTAQQMHETLSADFPGMSPNTVYLTLNQLTTVGVIRSFNVGGNTVYDSNTATHDHAHCRSCGALKDILNSSHIKAENQLTISGWELEWGTRLWSGLCPDCQ